MELAVVRSPLSSANSAVDNDPQSSLIGAELTKSSLFDELCQRKYVSEFLYMSGIYLPPEYFTGTWKIRLQRLWAIIIRLSLLFSKSISTYNMILDATSSVSVSITFVFYLCVVTIVLQS